MLLPSSSEDVTRVLRWCFRGGSVYVVLFRFVSKQNLQRCGDAVFDILIKNIGLALIRNGCPLHKQKQPNERQRNV